MTLVVAHCPECEEEGAPIVRTTAEDLVAMHNDYHHDGESVAAIREGNA